MKATSEKYTGEIKNESYHGKGKLIRGAPKDEIYYSYEGDFLNGCEEGKGKMKDFYWGIDYYKGDFRKGKPEGEGHMKWSENPKGVEEDSKQYKG